MKLKAPAGVKTLYARGQEIEVVNGFVEVIGEAVEQLLRTGYEKVERKDEKAEEVDIKRKKPKEFSIQSNLHGITVLYFLHSSP